MSIPLTINGAVFEYPVNLDEDWGVDATGWAQAVTNGMLQMAGGNFPLTADVNFGPNFGLLSKYFETRAANPSTLGTIRLASADPGIGFRNSANSGNLILTTDSSNDLIYPNGLKLSTSLTLQTMGTVAFRDGFNTNTISMHAPGSTATYGFTLPPNTGSNGQVLQTDGSGITTWVNATGTGTVNSGTQYQLAYYATTGNTISGDSFIRTNAADQLLVTSGSLSTPSYSFISDPDTGLYSITDGRFAVVGNANVLIDINSGVGIAFQNTPQVPTVSFPNGTLFIPGISFTADPDTGFRRLAPNNIEIIAGGILAFSADTLNTVSHLPLTMNGNKIISLADGTIATDAATFGQIPPTGAIIMYGGASAPTGWLLCDGSSYTTAAQPGLFAVVGYTFGGAGANFNVPNLTNFAPVGKGGSIAPSLGNTSGSTSVTPTQTPHNHTQDPHLHVSAVLDIAGQLATANAGPFTSTLTALDSHVFVAAGGAGPDTQSTLNTLNTTATNQSTTATNNSMSVVQPSIGLTFIIKA